MSGSLDNTFSQRHDLVKRLFKPCKDLFSNGHCKAFNAFNCS